MCGTRTAAGEGGADLDTLCTDSCSIIIYMLMIFLLRNSNKKGQINVKSTIFAT